jgi:hypothetical protein
MLFCVVLVALYSRIRIYTPSYPHKYLHYQTGFDII